MSGKVHNKRRNVGLLYEFLVRAASAALIDNDHNKSESALRILKKYFGNDSELAKEYKLFNSLLQVEAKTDAGASRVLHDAETAAKSLNVENLQRTKTALISEINKTFDDPTFWDAPITNYKIFATIGTLVSEWSNANSRKIDLKYMNDLEETLIEWLKAEKKPQQTISENVKRADGTERLTLRLAIRKFNEKYSNTLAAEQRDIVRLWALSYHSGKQEPIIKFLSEVKNTTLDAIENTLANSTDTVMLNENLRQAQKKIAGEKLEVVDDNTVTRFIMYSRLKSELTSKEDD